MHTPLNIQIIGSEVAIAWDDGLESYHPAPALRAASPSAETRGERDILGNLHGGDQGAKNYDSITVLDWKKIGNYAIAFHFSDGHNSGLYTYDYLRELAKKTSN